MKKFFKPLVLICIAFILTIIIAALWRGRDETTADKKTHSSAPSRLLQMGPVVGGFSSTDTIGELVVKMEASRMWYKKSKILGFDSAIFKKLVASNFSLTILKGEKKLISLSKNKVELSSDLKTISIKKPTITYPTDMGHPDLIQFNKDELKLKIKTGTSEKTWDLAKM